MRNSALAFFIGRRAQTLQRRVDERDEVLIHQACDDILDELNRIDGDTSDIKEHLEEINEIIEDREGDLSGWNDWKPVLDDSSAVINQLQSYFS